MSKQASSITSSEHALSKKRKASRVRLPTPPPDPVTNDDDPDSCKSKKIHETDAEFLEYLESLQKPSLNRSNSTFAPAIATEDAFDHLDKLYKLMEQMLELREQNARLHRRIRDLEHLRNLQNMHQQLKHFNVNVDVLDVDKESEMAESLLDSIINESKRDPKQKHTQFRFRQSILRRQRNRDNSFNLDKLPTEMETVHDRRLSELSGADKKVSKWTKVKAAFRWEKASQTVSDIRSQDSGLGGMLPVNYEVARYLRVPSMSDDPGLSPADSGAAGISTPGTMSSASSVEDVFWHSK